MKIFLAVGLSLVLVAWITLRRSGATPAPGASGRLPAVQSASFPVRLVSGTEVLEFAAPPRRILPGNAAWVDYLSLLVGPERLVALPTEAFGYSRLGPDEEAWAALPALTGFDGERVLGLAPDLVLAHSWQNAETLATLRRAGIPLLVLPVPEGWEEIRATLDLLAVVLGTPERARELQASFEERRVALERRARPFAGWRALTYTNLGAGGWTSGARTTGDVLLGLAGLGNAAARAGLVGDVPADQERLLALAPDLFVVGRPDRSESSPPSAEFLLAEPALQGLQAIRERRILSLAPALFTSASPELLTGAERLVDQLVELAGPR